MNCPLLKKGLLTAIAFGLAGLKLHRQGESRVKHTSDGDVPSQHLNEASCTRFDRNIGKTAVQPHLNFLGADAVGLATCRAERSIPASPRGGLFGGDAGVSAIEPDAVEAVAASPEAVTPDPAAAAAARRSADCCSHGGSCTGSAATAALTARPAGAAAVSAASAGAAAASTSTAASSSGGGGGGGEPTGDVGSSGIGGFKMGSGSGTWLMWL